MKQHQIERMHQSICESKQAIELAHALVSPSPVALISKFKGMNAAKTFLEIVYGSARFKAIVQLHAVLDPDTKNISIHALRKGLRPISKTLDDPIEQEREAQIKEIDRILRDHANTIKGVARLRHQQLSHISSSEDPELTYENAHLTHEKLKGLLEDLNIFSTRVIRSINSCVPVFKTGEKALVDAFTALEKSVEK